MTQPEPDSLRQRIAAVFRTKDGQLPAWTKRDAGPQAHVDAVLAVVQPVIDEVDLLRRGAAERVDLLEEARDALSAAGQNGAHGDDWPNIAPSIRALGERASNAEATLAKLGGRVQAIADEARGSIREWLLDALNDIPDGFHPSTAERAEQAEAALARVRELHREWKHNPHGGLSYCAHCEKDGDVVRWPCPTIRALTPPQTEESD